MPEEEWLSERDFGLGGSDIGTILGFNQYKASVELFREKVGVVDAPKLRSRQIFFGHRSEDDVLDLGEFYDFSIPTRDYKWDDAWLENAWNNNRLRKITHFQNLVVNSKYPWIQANVDSLINHDEETRKADYIAEAKNTTIQANKGYVGWVNPSYICQGITYSIVMEPILSSASFMIFQKFDGNQLFARHISASEEEWLVNDILEESYSFYQNVLKGREIVANATNKRQAMKGIREIEPGPDDTDRYEKFINADHASLEEFESRVGSANEMKYLMALNKYDKKAKAYARKAKLFTNTLKKTMTDEELSEITWEDGSRIRWKNKFTPKLVEA
jgi:hypothetical protein